MSEPTEFVLLVSDSSFVRLTKTIVVQLHGIGLEDAYHLLKSGGHLSSAWSLEDFFSAVHGQQVPDLTRAIPTPRIPIRKG